MFKLSTYVADPLRLEASLWSHPVTGQQVSLSEELKMMLPDITQRNLEQEGEGPLEVLQQLLAAELAARGFLIPLAWQHREDEYLAGIAPFQATAETLFGIQAGELHSLPVTARVAAMSCSLSGRSTAAAELRSLSARTSLGKNLFSLRSSAALDGSLAFDLGDKVVSGLSRSALLQQTAQHIAALPAGCAPLILADSAIWTHSLLKGLELRAAAPAPQQLIFLDDLWHLEGQGQSQAQQQRLPPLSEQNLFDHVLHDFSELRLHLLGLDGFQPLAAAAAMPALARRGSQYSLDVLAAAPLAGLSLWPENSAETGFVLACNAQLLSPSYQALWSPSAILASVRRLAERGRCQGIVIWGLEPDTKAFQRSLASLLLTLLEGMLR